MKKSHTDWKQPAPAKATSSPSGRKRGTNGVTPVILLEFISEFADLHVAQLTANTGGLTGPGAAVNITTTSVGGPGDEVQEFNEKGEFVLMFGKEVNKTKVEGGVATPEEQDVCTKVEHELGADCQPGAQGTEPGAFEHPAYVAVDQSTGDVYVGDTGDAVVTKFEEKEVAGAKLVVPVTTWGNGGSNEEPNGQLVGKPAGQECVAPSTACPAAEPFVALSGIAVDPKGNLWADGVDSREGPYHGVQRIFEFARATGTFTGNAWDPVCRYGQPASHPVNEAVSPSTPKTMST